jgi:DNA-binding response OmpR family regulator
MNRNVLVVEDDKDIADLIELHLEDLNFGMDRASDGESGLKKALDNDYALIILDIMLPKMNGLDVCRKIREQKKSLPILMLTSKSDELDMILGLELGADDYMTKPFSVRELVARIKAIIRRMEAVIEERFTTDRNAELNFGGLYLNLEKRTVQLNGSNVELTAKEFDLLALFTAHPGKAFTRQNLLNQVWGYQFLGYEHTVNSHINRLRSKIELDPSQPVFIKTVWGVGYKFAEKEELSAVL